MKKIFIILSVFLVSGCSSLKEIKEEKGTSIVNLDNSKESYKLYNTDVYGDILIYPEEYIDDYYEMYDFVEEKEAYDVAGYINDKYEDEQVIYAIWAAVAINAPIYPEAYARTYLDEVIEDYEGTDIESWKDKTTLQYSYYYGSIYLITYYDFYGINNEISNFVAVYSKAKLRSLTGVNISKTNDYEDGESIEKQLSEAYDDMIGSF